jgi:hypothetical protein
MLLSSATICFCLRLSPEAKQNEIGRLEKQPGHRLGLGVSRLNPHDTIHNAAARACYPLAAARAGQHHSAFPIRWPAYRLNAPLSLLSRSLTSDSGTATRIHTIPPVVFQHILSASDYRRVAMAMWGPTHTLESLFFLYRLLGGFIEEDPPPVTWLPVDLVRPG